MTGPTRWIRNLTPVRALRRRLREIEYHSARRQSTRWSRMGDIAFFAAPLLAAAATVWMHHGVTLADDQQTTILRVGTSLGGVPSATIIIDSAVPEWPARPFGDIELVVSGSRQGFPLVTRQNPGTLTINFPRPLPVSPPDPLSDPDMHRVATSAIDVDGPPSLQALWHGQAQGRTHWLAIAGNVGLWWFVLLVVMMFLIQSARFTTWFVSEAHRLRTRKRRISGRCPSCGYDTRASVWSERCPECGTVLD